MKARQLCLAVILVVVFGHIPYADAPAVAEQSIPTCQLEAHVIGHVTAVKNPAISPFSVMSQGDYIVIGTVNQTSQLGGGSATIDPLEFAFNLNLFSVSLSKPEQLIHLITLDAKSSSYDSEYGGVYSAPENAKPLLAQNGNLIIWETPPQLTLIKMADGVPVKVEDHHLLPREQAADANGDGRFDMWVLEASPDGAYILWAERFDEGEDLASRLHLYDVARAVSSPIAAIWSPEDQEGFTQDGKFIFYQQASTAGGGFYGRSIDPDAKPFPLAAELAWADVVPLQQSRILFIADEDGHEKLYMADLATQTRTLLYSYAARSSFSVSADRELVVTSDVREGEVIVPLISLNDEQVRLLTLPYDFPEESQQFSFSPGNRYLIHWNGVEHEVFAISEHPTVLMSTEFLTKQNFSPDGQYLIYENYDDSEIETVYQFSLANQETVEIISGSVFQSFSGYSHDGTYAFIEEGYGLRSAPYLPVSLYRWTVGSQDELCEIANGIGANILGIGDNSLIYSMWEDGVATLYSVPIAVE